MANTSEKQSERFETPVEIALSANLGMAKVMNVPRKIFETQLATGSELLNFASRRLEAQAELLGTVSHCGKLEDIVGAQRKFFEFASEQYSKEFGHIFNATWKNIAHMADAAIVEPPAKL